MAATAAPVPFGKTAAVLENQSRQSAATSALPPQLAPQKPPPVGWFSRCVFGWVAPLVQQGFAHELTDEDTFPLPRPLRPDVVAAEVRACWTGNKPVPSVPLSRLKGSAPF